MKGIFRTTGGARPGFLLGDCNGLSAARVRRRRWPARLQRRPYYDGEPYRKQDHDDLEYQVLPGTVGRKQTADRWQSATLLRRGFMVDAAAHLGVPPHATCGHWEDGQGDPDPWDPRRIDLALATRPAATALVNYQVHTTPAARAAADHLPFSIDVTPEAIKKGER
ncbi:hypothetical protein [Streptomyces sp. SBT349]|uniref:hypothetical protein n=1 Tax=Streptomyces sp. SBT349 TaxID=1580539 RepID=UPI00069E38E7|nr:hypothetical protein [Streptomyces sp. SBT349]